MALPPGFPSDSTPQITESSDDDPITVELPQDETPEGTKVKIEIDEDGRTVIELNPQPEKPDPGESSHDDNLAEVLPDSVLGPIAAKLIDQIENDDRSRAEWLETRAKGMDLLGFKLEEPRGDIAISSAPVEGQSVVRHTLLAEAVARFQSTASAELLPAAGPVKVRSDATQKPLGAQDIPAPGAQFSPEQLLSYQTNDQRSDALAEALEKDFNHYLTVTDRSYRADTDRMLWSVGFGGCAFKKVYQDPIRRMPISRAVDAADLIVGNAEMDLHDAGRITHRIMMRRSTLIRMQIAGAYRNIALTPPSPHLNPVDEKVAEIQGFQTSPFNMEDSEYTIYECYCELDIPGYEHIDDDGQPTGLPLPYRVTIEKDSRQILEIRRNWHEDDQNFMAKQVFVKYPFIPTYGFYETGLLHLLGNAERALTAAWRIVLDAGMFSTFPGFLYSEDVARQDSNNFRVPPGGGKKIQTGGRPIKDVVSEMPYQPIGPAFPTFITNVEQTAQRLAGTADMQVGEGKMDAPVGTTLALIEQATKILSAVHVRLHAAQSEEFQLLKELFRRDPEAFWRHNKRPAMQWQVDQFIQALNDYDLVPAADPNISSHLQRIMKAQAVKQVAMLSAMLYDMQAVDRYVLGMIGITDIDHLFNPNPQMPNPNAGTDMAKMAAVQQKAQQVAIQEQGRQQEMAQKTQQAQMENDVRAHQAALESNERAADRISRERIADSRAAIERAKIAAELQMHQQPSGDAHVATAGDLQQHQTPSADARLGHQATMAQHQTPSADAQMGHAMTMAQHAAPSADAQLAAQNKALQQNEGENT